MTRLLQKSPLKELSIKGKARAVLNPTPPVTPKTPRPGKRDRRRRKAPTAKSTGVIDLTVEDTDSNSRDQPIEEAFVRFSGADELDSPGAGPSRLPTPPTLYTPTAFTQISRSILASLSKRPSPIPRSREHSPHKPPVRSGNIVRAEQPRPISSVPSVGRNHAPPPDGVSEHFDPPGLFGTSMMPKIGTSGQVDLQRSDKAGKDGGHSEEDTLLLPSHVMLDTIAPLTTEASGETVDVEGEGNSRDRDNMMEGLHFLDDDTSKVDSFAF